MSNSLLNHISSIDVSNQWQNTLPCIIKPFKGESLYGFLLRLDIANRFPSGTVLSYISKHNTGVKVLNRPGLFLCSTIFETNTLSELINIPNSIILDLTLLNLIKNVFHTNSPYPELLGYSTDFKICPQCIQSHSLPLIHVFKNINTCIEHNTYLTSHCKCGHKIVLFTKNIEYLTCPNCNTRYEKLEIEYVDKTSVEFKKQLYFYKAYESLIHKGSGLIKIGEKVPLGFENRLHYISISKDIRYQQFKDTFGYEASNLKNGHGLSNISLSKILDMLYELGYSPSAFRNIKPDKSVNKLANLSPNGSLDKSEHICPNVYCEYYRVIGQENIKFYGKRKSKMGDYVIEEYCNSCGTRFIGNNIIQSYDYNPGLRQIVIERARKRIELWQSSLIEACEYMIEKRIPITLTGCFKKARIPIGKTYFTDRLGLIPILEKYADIQRADTYEWSRELGPKEVESFLRRIYKRKRC